MSKPVAALFVGAGLLHVLGAAPVRHAYSRWGYPEWFRVAVGALEIEAGALVAFDTTRRIGVLQLLAIMAGAACTHAKTPGERLRVVMPAAMAAALVNTLRSYS